MHDLLGLILIAAFISALVGGYFKNHWALAVASILLVVIEALRGVKL